MKFFSSYFVFLLSLHPHKVCKANLGRCGLTTVDNIDWPDAPRHLCHIQRLLFTKLDMHQRNGMNAVIVQVAILQMHFIHAIRDGANMAYGCAGQSTFSLLRSAGVYNARTHKGRFHAWDESIIVLFSHQNFINNIYTYPQNESQVVSYLWRKKYFDPVTRAQQFGKL
jgi:hypothetical protein